MGNLKKEYILKKELFLKESAKLHYKLVVY